MLELTLGAPFSNHLVLQRERENPIWGWDLSGQRIVVTIEGGRRRIAERGVIADNDGRWLVRLPALEAGGPYRVRIVGSREVVLNDVLVGEVWLASGQSNMERRVHQAEHEPELVQGANQGAIRILKVPTRASRLPESHFEAEWTVCSPETVEGFSAVAFFFAREIHARLDVPIGIIDASWGGTYIEAWMGLDALRSVVPNLAEQLAELARDSIRVDQIREEYLQRVQAWERESLPNDPGNVGLLDGWASESFDDESWPEMCLPCFWQASGLKFNGIVWFRRSINVPKAWGGHDIVLRLGAIDDFDQTYFNGVLIGEHPDGTPDAYRLPREYRVSGALVRPGRNVIAVRVFDRCGSGGFAGPPTAMNVSKFEGNGKPVSLAGAWKYAVELEIPLVSLDVFRSCPPPPHVLAEQHAPAAIFHGMIFPLLPLGLAGFLFYQGENNVEQHACYRQRLIALIRDWRTRFAQGTLPFLFVQLAGYRANGDWPFLREAQAEARSEPGVHMASAIDLGDPDDIHPRKKGPVGIRLAYLALNEVYGMGDIACYGPEMVRCEVHGRAMHVFYRHATGLRTSDHAAHVRAFELAGQDGRYRSAQAYIDGDSVVAESAEVQNPVSIRYAWRDYVEQNLVNAAGLPALPFRTDGCGAG